MPNSVMVPLDGSEKDARAMAVAAALADLTGGGLHLVRVLERPIESALAAPTAPSDALAMADAADDLSRAMAQVAERLGSQTRRRVTWEVLDSTDVAGALTRHALERDVDLLVMATRAARTAGRALWGSVADRVMRESPRPVALVPPGTDDMGGRHVELRRILVPLDGSALAAKAIDYVLSLPHADGLEYVLLQVVERDDERARADETLGAASAEMASQGAGEVEVGVVQAPDPATVIVEAVRDSLVDLIVMSTRGHGGLRRMVLGSVADGVVRSSDVPVVLLTPAYLEARDRAAR